MKKREFTAIVLATFVLILLGDGVVASVVLGPRGAAGNYNWNTIAFGWGLAVASSSLIVGADNNPAITLANAVRGDTPWSRVVPTFLGTFLGGFLGALAVYLVYRDGLVSAGMPNIWTSGPGAIYDTSAKHVGAYSLLTASVAEFFGTLVLMWSVLAVGDKKNAGMAKAGPFVVGGVILAIGLCLGGPSGYSLNPARDLAPRIFGLMAGSQGLFDGLYWLIPPVLVPCLSCVVATFLYDACLNSEKAARLTSGSLNQSPALGE
jgi:glycerol uptake facilitator protein